MTRTDSERLDFLQQIVEAANTKGVIIGGICYFSITIGRSRIGEGDDVRDAIDAAMDATIGAIPA